MEESAGGWRTEIGAGGRGLGLRAELESGLLGWAEASTDEGCKCQAGPRTLFRMHQGAGGGLGPFLLTVEVTASP